ncbi:MAG: hypothetical protein L0229_30450 [Blastocatellia bacterium]|nr:hypothetical protein [Blastocatellia bacterium]
MIDTGIPSNERSEIRLDIEHKTYEVFASVMGGGNNSNGKATLEVNERGISISPKRTRGLFALKPMDVSWGDLREIKRRRGRFKANIGVGRSELLGNKDVILQFQLKGESRSKADELNSVLDRLPAEAFSQRCPHCSGPVIKDVCRDCGKSFRLHQRKKGFQFLLIGGLLLIIGISLTSSSYQSASGEITVFYGLILMGAVLIILGLIRLVFGVRIS